jgi:hypothetical protein
MLHRGNGFNLLDESRSEFKRAIGLTWVGVDRMSMCFCQGCDCPYAYRPGRVVSLRSSSNAGSVGAIASTDRHSCATHYGEGQHHVIASGFCHFERLAAPHCRTREVARIVQKPACELGVSGSDRQEFIEFVTACTLSQLLNSAEVIEDAGQHNARTEKIVGRILIL